VATEGAALAFATAYPELAVVTLHGVLHDRQAETGAARRARAAGIEA